MIRSVILATIVTAVSHVAHAQVSPIDRLAWMAGCWEQRAPGRVVTEMWMAPAAGTMMGSSRTVVGTAVREFEHLRIVARGDTLVYIALPSGQALTEFKSTSVGDGSVKFENPTHDFPKLIGYVKAGADSIVPRIEGGGRTIQYPMKRVSCTGH